MWHHNSDFPEELFNYFILDKMLQTELERVTDTVNMIPEDQFLSNDDPEIIDHIYSKMRIMPVELHEESMSLDNQETSIHKSSKNSFLNAKRSQQSFARGIKIAVSIPFIGDQKIWKTCPNSMKSSLPKARLIFDRHNEESGSIEIIIEHPVSKENDAEIIKKSIDSTLADIKWYLNNINNTVTDHNVNLRNHVEKYVKDRRQRLRVHSEIVKQINIPLKQKPGSPDYSKLPIRRRVVKPLSSKPNKPAEPAIDDKEYEYILGVIRHEGRTFESTPDTYAVHDEEEIRDILLAHLNGHYQGDATGETFRKAGKTDIRIEDKNRAAFVAECKVWHGPQELNKGVDQLLGYLTWRDCKSALIIFNKDVAGFTGIQKKVPEILKQHSNHIQEITTNQLGEWRYRFVSADDPDRHITVHVFLFNLYVKAKSDNKG